MNYGWQGGENDSAASLDTRRLREYFIVALQILQL